MSEASSSDAASGAAQRAARDVASGGARSAIDSAALRDGAPLRREASIVAVALALLAFVLGAGGWTWRIDQTLYDAGLRLTERAASPDIVIVAIDDASLAAIGRWPWPRAVHATLIDKLAGAGTRAIGLDLFVVEPDSDPTQDQVLGEAIRRAGNVVLPVAFVSGAEGVRELLPVPAVRAGAHLGHVDAELDADSILRTAWLRAGPGAPTRPHFASALMVAAHEAPPLPPAAQSAPPRPADLRAWQRDGRTLIRYNGPPGNVTRVSYAALLRGDVAPATLKGKYVLIGSTAIGVGDAFATPVSGRERPMPGIEITANLLDNLKHGATLRAVPPIWVGGGAAMLALVLLAAMLRLRPRTALVVSLGVALAVFPLGVLLLGTGVWLPPATFALVALLAYPLWSWRRLEAATAYIDRELERLPDAGLAEADAATGDRFAARIGALRRAGDRARSAQRLVAETLDALPEAVFVTRADGRIEFANPRALALVGRQAVDGVRGQPLEALLRGLVPQELASWAALFDRAARAHATVVTEARSTTLGDYLVRCAPLRDADVLLGDAAGFVVAFADVTRLKTAERQRDDVLSFVSHDIRSPQASLISLVELRRAGQLEIDESSLLAHVEDLARRSLGLADEFVQVARAEAKPLELDLADPRLLLDDVVRELQPQAQRKNVRIDVRIEKGAPETLPALRIERALVVRALGNLVNNAVKFSPPGATVVTALAVQDGFCIFTVEDQGPGIAEEDMARLFQRYQRLESGSVLRMQPGVGLGLVFVDAVARRHGGTVAVKSRVGAGSRFEMRLPLEGEGRRRVESVGVEGAPRG